jgi:ABC-type polysaccharide/polyol phosphate transport system ATPase subunit
MPSINVQNVSLTFKLRKNKNVTLKEYLVKGLFRPSSNPGVTIHALENLSLTAREGDRLGIIGHNGAGKSTLLKLLAGIYPPTQGSVEIQGRICSLFDIALGFEHEATGWENIVFRSYLHGESPASVRAKLNSIGEFTELGEFLSVPVRNYSAGMLMRLAFAIATASDPDVLLIDEVLAVGDMAFQLKAKARMKELMASSRLMVVVSHDLKSLKEMCNRVIWMKHGQIVMDGPSTDVVRRYVESVSGQPQPAKEMATAKDAA